MKSFLITGGAGFIGSHLCEELIKENRVICIDNLSSGNFDNIAHLIGHENFEFIRHNIIDPIEINEPLNGIFHLASRASPPDYQQHQVETALTNSIGTNNIIKLAIKNNCPILFTSTSEIYGEPLEHPQKESYWGNVNSIGIRSCYDESKRFSESLLMSYLRESRVNIKIVRIFNTYGPRIKIDDGRVISNFITQALENKPLTIYGDGTQTRSICYISDMIQGLIKMFNSKETGPINLGNPIEYKVIELAELIKKLTNSKSELVFGSLPEDDPKRRKPDISKAKHLLNWEPKIKPEEGLKKTIDWFKEHL